MDQQELKNTLEKHRKWVLGEDGGSRANLRDADLRYANLRYANLRDANLRYADLEDADLRYANLTIIKTDFFKILTAAKNEATYLYKSLHEGKINGSTYQGECACLVGTIANARDVDYRRLLDIEVDSGRPAEKWFLSIREGDTPKNNPVSQIVSEWTEEFMKENGIEIPEMKIVWE